MADHEEKSGGAAARMFKAQAVATKMLSFLEADEVAALSQTDKSWRGDVGRMERDGVRLSARWIAEFAAQFVALREDLQSWLRHPFEVKDGQVVLHEATRLLTPFEFQTPLPTQHQARAYMQSLYAPLSRSAVLPPWADADPAVRGLLEQGRVGLVLAELCFAQRLDAEGRMPSAPLHSDPVIQAMRYMIVADPSARVLGGLVLLELLTRRPGQLGLSMVTVDVAQLFAMALRGDSLLPEFGGVTTIACIIGYAYLLWRRQVAAQVHDEGLRMTKNMTAVVEKQRHKPQARSPYYIRPEWVRTDSWYAVFGFPRTGMTESQVGSVIGPRDPQ